MPDVEYQSTINGQPRRLVYRRVSEALYTAVLDLHEQRAVPEAITWRARRLYDQAALRRVWAACRAELEAQPWEVPAALETAGRQELQR